MEPNPNHYPLARAIREAYASGEEDEALDPRALVDKSGAPIGSVNPGDVVIFYDIRGEREIELTQSFVDPEFDKFKVHDGTAEFVTMIQYDSSLPVKVAFPPEEHLKDTLCSVVSQAGLKQLKIAESEKAVHLGFFFNGKNENPEPGEDRIVIPSPEGIADYSEIPELSVSQAAESLIANCQKEEYSLIIGNFANVDVLGHIENEKSAIQAVEAVDDALGKVVAASKKSGRWTIVTADHGTVESWLYPEGTINTGHTANPVPFIIIPPDGHGNDISVRDGGTLTDVAPTVLDMMGLPKPDTMTGETLLQRQEDDSSARVLLLILDGWGHRDETEGNLIAQANTPAFDTLRQENPHTTLLAAGESVGMPRGSVGNSESGHLHMGCGRIIYSDRLRIDADMENGEFFKNDAFLWAMNRAKSEKKPLHLLGIVSFYSSHGSMKHLFALMDMAKEQGIEELYIHTLLGRRGERPESGARYIAQVEARCKEIGLGKVATVMGRFWALDREYNWDRVEKAYRSIAFGDAVLVVDK